MSDAVSMYEWGAYFGMVAGSLDATTPGGAACQPHYDYCSSEYNANLPCEDQHCCCVDVELGVSIFCVFDGHGGDLASRFAKRHMTDIIRARLTPQSTPTEVRRSKTIPSSFFSFFHNRDVCACTARLGDN